MKKLSNLFAVTALSAASAAPALAQDANDPFVSSQDGVQITTTTGVALGVTALAFIAGLSDSDSSSSSTTTSTTP